jgi:DNA-binding NarL/FixJ family response regulator
MSAVRIVADGPVVHEQAVQLLTDGGFAIDQRRAKLVVVLHESGADDRIDALREICEATDGTVVAAMPDEVGSGVLRRALRAGANGIVLDGQIATTLLATVRAVAAGQLAMPPKLRRQVAPRPLSHREKQILALVASGYTNSQIAQTLFVAESTVKTHLSSVFGKLETRSRSEAAALVLDPEEGFGLGILSAAGVAPA